MGGDGLPFWEVACGGGRPVQPAACRAAALMARRTCTVVHLACPVARAQSLPMPPPELLTHMLRRAALQFDLVSTMSLPLR